MESPPGRPLSVLVVDDHPDTAEATALLLTLAGHTARVAHSCAEALQAAEWGPADVVVLDLALPDGDGYTLAGKLLALPGRPPAIVVVTGRQNLEERSRLAGFHRHLLKPVDPRELLEAVQSAAGRGPDPGTAR